MKKNELKPFMSWLESTGCEACTISEVAVLLPHWRQHRAMGLI